MTYNRFISGLRQAASRSTARSWPTSRSPTRAPSRAWSPAPARASTARTRPDGRPRAARMDVITSPSNPAVRAARRLARPSARARADGRFLLEGPRGSGPRSTPATSPSGCWPPSGPRPAAGLVNLARQRGAQVTLVAEPVLSALAATTTPQGLVAVVPSVLGPWTTFPPPRPGLRAGRGPRPRQRRHRATGGRRLRRRRRGHDQGVDLQSPKAARAAAGSLFHLPVVAGAPWPELAAALRGRGLRLVEADPHADATVDRAPWASPSPWSSATRPTACRRDRRRPRPGRPGPLAGRAESLNLAAAAAVLLYETARQQRRLPVSREEASVGR